MKFEISSIEIKNFRQYRGNNVIDLNTDDFKKNVSIILGRNGAGKSNILNALTWCFYGVEAHSESNNEDNTKIPIINTFELDALKNNGVAEAKVEIYLETENGSWVIKRTLSASKNSIGEFSIDDKSQLSLVYNVNGQDKIATGDQTQILINNLLPEALRSFFFMDGEKLREFFNRDTARNVGDAIEKVSQLDLLYQAIRNLGVYERTLMRGVKETTPQLNSISDKITQYEKTLETNREDLKGNQDKLNIAREKLSKVKKDLLNSGIQVIEQKEKERQELEADVKRFKYINERNVFDRNRYLVKIAPFIYLKKEIKGALDVIYQKIDKGELPAAIKESFVNELIEKKVCICGTKIDSSVEKTLREYMQTLQYSDLNEIANEGKTKFIEILKEIDDFEEKTEEFHNKITKINDEIEDKQIKIEHIKKEIADTDKEDIKKKEKEREDLDRQIGRLEQNEKILINEIQIYERYLNEERGNYTKALDMTSKNNLLKRKLKLIRDSIKVLEDTEATIKDRLRNELEQKTNENFFKLIRKKGAFKKVIITEEYEVKVENMHGYNAIDSLSAGEYMILGIAFMSAMMNISGFKAPVIIDTPLGKIDDEHRDKITNELPVFLEGTQLLLFVTPTEFDSNVQSNLKKFIADGNNYKIDENEENSISKLVKNGR